MQIEIKKPTDFKKVPWKNGLGFTLELAANDGGTMSAFDWRLSIATVSKDGVFSDFSGYWRNLILLSGNGIELTHSDSPTNLLKNSLDVAKFNGGAVTNGRLIDGEITDFNVMVKPEKYHLVVETYPEHTHTDVNVDELVFVYSLQSAAELVYNGESHMLPAGHLLRLTNTTINGDEKMALRGEAMIVISLTERH